MYIYPPQPLEGRRLGSWGHAARWERVRARAKCPPSSTCLDRSNSKAEALTKESSEFIPEFVEREHEAGDLFYGGNSEFVPEFVEEEHEAGDISTRVMVRF